MRVGLQRRSLGAGEERVRGYGLGREGAERHAAGWGGQELGA